MTVLLVPGFMADATLWDDMLPALAPLGPVHHGDTGRDGTIEAMAARAVAATPGRFVAIGFSMGGYVAREVARLAPDRVQALVLVATSARGDRLETRTRRLAAAERTEQTGFRGLSRAAVQASLHPDRAKDEALVARIRAMGDRLGGEVFVRQSRIPRADPDSRLGEIRVPTLVIAADHDRLRSLEEARELRDGIPGAELRVIEGSGHMIPIEAPGELPALILSWLAAQAET